MLVAMVGVTSEPGAFNTRNTVLARLMPSYMARYLSLIGPAVGITVKFWIKTAVLWSPALEPLLASPPVTEPQSQLKLDPNQP